VVFSAVFFALVCRQLLLATTAAAVAAALDGLFLNFSPLWTDWLTD
jgi:hypothetical protein